MISKSIRNTGIDLVGGVPWGTHISYFYYSNLDLYKHLIPFFKEGLENNEYCIWFISKNINRDEAVRFLKKEIADFEYYLEEGFFQFYDYKLIFYEEKQLNLEAAFKKIINIYDDLVTENFEGLRISFDSAWIKKKDFQQFLDFEIHLDNIIKDYQMIALSTYPINKFFKYEILDIASSHQYVLFNKNGELRIIENFERKKVEEEKKIFSVLSKGIAHNLNKFLTVIKGYNDLALTKVEKKSEVYDYLKEIKHSVNNFENLIGEFIKLGLNDDEEGYIDVEINDVIKKLLDMLTHLITENVKIKTDLDPHLWKIKANEIKIEQCFMNLILNAKDAMPEGGILAISTKNVQINEESNLTIPHSRPGKFILISVRDNGIGMSETTLKKLFKPFFTTKKEQKGTGLGLSITQIYVIQHGGWINVKSKLNEGSQFDIYLPTLNSH